jgi:hypothetical protein
MNHQTIRRAAPLIYGLAVLVAVLFAQDALLPVVIVGAVLLGLVYVVTSGAVAGRGRARNRQRNR